MRLESLRLILSAVFLVCFGACSGQSGNYANSSLHFARAEQERSAGRFQGAAVAYRKGLEYARKVAEADSSEYSKLMTAGLLKLGPFDYHEINDYLSGLVSLWEVSHQNLLAKAVLLTEKIPGSEGQVQLVIRLANSYDTRNEGQTAATLVNAAISLVKKIKIDSERAWALHDIAEVSLVIGQDKTALSLMDEVVTILERRPSDLETPDLLSSIVALMETITSGPEVLAILDRAEEICLELDLVDSNMILPEIAFIYAALGHCTEAGDVLHGLEPEDFDDYDECYDSDHEDYSVEDSPDMLRLEMLFDLHDACLDVDREAALELLDEAADEALEFQWWEFVADVAWAYAAAGEAEKAVDLVRSINDNHEQALALLAIINEFEDDNTGHLELLEQTISNIPEFSDAVQLRIGQARYLAGQNNLKAASDICLEAWKKLNSMATEARIDPVQHLLGCVMFTDAIPGSEILSQVRDVSASISLVQVRLGYLLSIHRTLFSAGKRDLAALILKDAVRLATENKLARGQPDMACHIVLVAIDSQFHDIAVEAAELMETVSRSACLKQASASAIGGQLDDRLAQMLPKEQASKDDPGDSIPVLKTNGKLPRAKAESCAVRLRELARSEDPAYQINGLIALTECCQPPGRVLSPEEIQALSEIEVE